MSIFALPVIVPDGAASAPAGHVGRQSCCPL